MLSSSSDLLFTGAIAFVVYRVLVIVYRLTLHPLAKFPGPKLAGATSLYEHYYDAIKGGVFLFEIERLHEIYGPIIRISPGELHIKDSSFYDDIYSSALNNQKRDKTWLWSIQGNSPTSVAFTQGHDLHRIRRAALAPFFSAKSVALLEPRLKEKVETVTRRLGERLKTGEIVRLDAVYTALTTDVITEYCFGKSYDYLLEEDFKIDWKLNMQSLLETTAARRAAPNFSNWMTALPDIVAITLLPFLKAPIDFQNDIAKKVKGAYAKYQDKQPPDNSIFSALLNNDELPQEEKNMTHLIHEGITMVAAGVETTARALGNASFYLLNDKETLQKLRKELKEAIPDPNELPTWGQLQQLPYLSGVVQETIRLSYGVVTRSPRMPHQELRYKDWVIPAMTPITQIAYFVVMDPEIFPEPEKFKPERWFNNKRLEKYLVNFGKGTRICIGMNLAHSEMYLTIAAVFRSFEFELFETTVDDVKLHHDCFIAGPQRGSKGVRVHVTERLP